MTKATMDARLTWLVKLVRPVTTISWGGAWIMETKVLLRWEGSPVLSLGRGAHAWDGVVSRRATRVGPGGSRKFTYLVQKPVSTIGFTKRFQDLIQVPDSQKPIQESDFRNWFPTNRFSSVNFRSVKQYRNRGSGNNQGRFCGLKEAAGLTFTSVRGTRTCRAGCQRDPFFSGVAFLSGQVSGLVC